MSSTLLLLLFFALTPLLAGRYRMSSSAADNSFMVQIHYNDKFICTASAVSHRHIVTAAHCLPNNSPWNEYYVLTAVKQKFSKSINSIYDRRIPSDYNRHDFIADIAVALVAFPLPAIAKLCSKPIKVGDAVTLSAYEKGGKTYESNAAISPQLSVIELKGCSKEHDTKLTSNTICAGTKKKIPCGDTGGSLVHNGELCGIQGWTYGKAGASIVFMSIPPYDKFIKKAMQEMKASNCK